MVTIEVKNLSKYYGNTKAVDDITFDVNEGEIFGFLGPNGAGKSTTINCMMNFISPTKGTIKIFGKDSKLNSSELKKDIGFLTSDVNLYESLTGKDHFNFIESVRGKSRNLKQLVIDFDIDQNKKVKTLSIGNKQKLAIIMAFMNEPKLILLDEPTRGLDPLFQKVTYEYLHNFRKNGSTIFMSSHNLSEVDKLCDHIGILKEGKLQTVETLTSLKDKSIYNIHFNTNDDLSNFNYSGVDKLVKNIDGSYSLKLKGNIDSFIKYISKFNLTDIEITHSSLEELFMEYYK